MSGQVRWYNNRSYQLSIPPEHDLSPLFQRNRFVHKISADDDGSPIASTAVSAMVP
jgi:hypothetical protein